MADHPAMPPASNALGGNVSFDDGLALSTRGQNLPRLIQTRSREQHARMARQSSYRQRAPGTMSLSSKAPFGQRHEDTDVELGRRASVLDVDRVPAPPPSFPFSRGSVVALERGHDIQREEWRHSVATNVLMTPQMRSQRLIGNSNPRYEWERYYKSEEELKPMKKKVREYYERNNYLIQQYLYIDRLLDSSMPHDLIQDYHENDESDRSIPPDVTVAEYDAAEAGNGDANSPKARLKRNKNLFRVPADEQTPLINKDNEAEDGKPIVPEAEFEEELDSDSRMVTIAIYVNFAANTILLALKIIVTILTSSLSVLASLVDAVLDFLSTFIVWVTTSLISRSDQDQHNYPVGRRRLEPVGVLVFSIIMITSFFQVAVEAVQRLHSDDHTVVQLTVPAVSIMVTTVVVKGLCWVYCRLIPNSSVQALAQDAMTDVVFNTFSIIFPLVGYYASIWWLDPLGGLLLSIYVIIAWSRTTRTHILNLTGHVASKDERNILLYLTMRFAHTIEKIQGLTAYHVGDKINVEVDIVLDERMNLRDSHDLSESLQYVLESVPGVERAFVHADYADKNLPTHMKH